MSVKPIDLQSNISQMNEVGKNEQARNEAVVQQQHVLDNESNEKSRLINTRLDESKKGEQTAIRDEQGRPRQRSRLKKKDEKKEGGASQIRKPSKDDRLGKIIDVFK
jgi:hypothetical protein